MTSAVVTPARLAELRRQRDLVREHLAWLEREVSAAEGRAPAVMPAGVAVEPHEADALVGQATASLREVEVFQPDPVGAAQSTRRGCLVAIVISFLVMVLIFTAIYFIGYRDRGILSGSRDGEPPAHSAPARPRR